MPNFSQLTLELLGEGILQGLNETGANSLYTAESNEISSDNERNLCGYIRELTTRTGDFLDRTEKASVIFSTFPTQPENFMTFFEHMKRLLCLPSDDVRFAVLQLLASLVNTTSSIFSFYVCSSGIIRDLVHNLRPETYTLNQPIHENMLNLLTQLLTLGTSAPLHQLPIGTDNPKETICRTISQLIIEPSSSYILFVSKQYPNRDLSNFETIHRTMEQILLLCASSPIIVSSPIAPTVLLSFVNSLNQHVVCSKVRQIVQSLYSVFYFVHPDRSFNRHDIASRRTRTSQHIMEEEGLFDDIEQRMSCPLMRMHGFQRVPTEFRPLCNQLPINITFV